MTTKSGYLVRVTTLIMENERKNFIKKSAELYAEQYGLGNEPNRQKFMARLSPEELLLFVQEFVKKRKHDKTKRH